MRSISEILFRLFCLFYEIPIFCRCLAKSGVLKLGLVMKVTGGHARVLNTDILQTEEGKCIIAKLREEGGNSG